MLTSPSHRRMPAFDFLVKRTCPLQFCNFTRLSRGGGLEEIRSCALSIGQILFAARHRRCHSFTARGVVARLFNPEDFDPSKLSVSFDNGSSSQPQLVLPRAYTLTHSDVTGELQLSIGPSYNQAQLDGWYTRLMRDEIVANWEYMNGNFSLHVHCHISGGHHLLAPAVLRNRIFQQEMPLVLQAIRYGDAALLASHPELDLSTVWVHFHSDDEEFNRADCWGPLLYAATSVGLKKVLA